MRTGDVVGKDRGERLIDTGTCPTAACGNHVYVVENQYDRLIETGSRFYCPGGHSQSFTPQPQIDADKRRREEAEAAATRERERREYAERRAEQVARTCPWPTCEGRLLASPKGLRQHLVKTHGAPWATPELSGEEVAQVLNGRDPAEVVS